MKQGGLSICIDYSSSYKGYAFMIEELKKSLILDERIKILIFMEILVVKSYKNNEKYRWKVW